MLHEFAVALPFLLTVGMGHCLHVSLLATWVLPCWHASCAQRLSCLNMDYACISKPCSPEEPTSTVINPRMKVYTSLLKL